MKFVYKMVTIGLVGLALGATLSSNVNAGNHIESVTSRSNSGSFSISEAAARSNQSQEQGQRQGQDQMQDQGQKQGINYAPVSNVEASDGHDWAPTVFVPNLTSGSISCAVSVSAGLSVPGGAASFGVAYESHECNVRQLLSKMGSALAGSTDPRASTVLKAVTCQSPIGWDSMELAAIEVGDSDLGCKNERPGHGGRFLVRSKEDLPKSYETMEISGEKVGKKVHQEFNDFNWSIMGG